MTIVLNGTSGITTPPVSVEGSTSGTITLAAPAVAGSNTQTLVAATDTLAPIVRATAVASTSGTSIDFTGIPSWVKRITVMFNGVSTSGTSIPLVQLGDSGGIETTTYTGQGDSFTTSSGAISVFTSTANTIGFNLSSSITAAAAGTLNGMATILNISGNSWVFTSYNSQYVGASGAGTGRKTLSDVLDRIRITTINGTDTFDAGSINILYE
jgi:hypothetical protein